MPTAVSAPVVQDKRSFMIRKAGKRRIKHRSKKTIQHISGRSSTISARQSRGTHGGILVAQLPEARLQRGDGPKVGFAGRGGVGRFARAAISHRSIQSGFDVSEASGDMIWNDARVKV